MNKITKKISTILLGVASIIFFCNGISVNAAEKCSHSNSYKKVLISETAEITESFAMMCNDCNEEIELTLPTNKHEYDLTEEIKEKDVVILEPTETLEGIKCDITITEAKVNFSKIDKIEAKKFPELKGTHSIFLAPSTQWKNLYHSKETNEGKVMNEIMDLIESNLKQYDNLTVTRNDKSKDVLGYIPDGNASNAELYFSLHSNGSDSHNARGPLVIANPNKKDSIKWAKHMYNNLLKIYPNPELGRKLIENSSYYEMNRVNTTSIIMEIAFHDQKEDEKWILENKQEIADNITSGLIEYMNTLK